MKTKVIIWTLALVIVNTGWFVISGQGAIQEINRPGADFAEEREANMVAVFSNEAEYEIEHCFTSNNGGTYNVSIKIESKSKVIYSWEGTTEDGCVSHSGDADVGEVTILTSIEDGVDAKASLETWPLKSTFIPGLFIFSILTVGVAYLEIFVRGHIIRKIEKIQEANVPEVTLNSMDDNGIWQEPIRKA